MNGISQAVQEYCTSEHFRFVDDALKPHAESLLSFWGEQIEESVAEDMRESLRAVARLDLPLEVRRSIPDLLRAFFTYLDTSGKMPGAGDWSSALDESEVEFQEGFRADGSVRGETVRKRFSPVGRNDPCPCGSGKKYKKCCVGLFD